MALIAGAKVLVHKLDYASGRTLITWHGVVTQRSDEVLVLRAVFQPRAGSPVYVDGVPFEPGDVFTEFYFLDRWYNVFHIARPDGHLKGWYCNVTRVPRLDEGSVSFVDLALDLFVHPDGRYTVLDEDEFAVAAAQVYDTADAAAARQALEALIGLARAGRMPVPAP